MKLYYLFILMFTYMPELVSGGQAAGAAPTSIQAGKTIYLRNCAGCHGADTHGTDRAPRLAGNRHLRSRSVAQLSSIIEHGIPAHGMPAFEFSHGALDAVTAFVHSLNSAASETFVPGDASAGKTFFWGEGHCAGCHMVQGKGSPIGPDLSSAGNELTVDEMRDVLLRPDDHITPGYELVSVKLRDGKTVAGFARDRTNFDLQLQDFSGGFHSFQTRDIETIRDENRSVLTPFRGSPEQMQDLIAYLSRLTGAHPGRSKASDVPPRSPAGTDFARIENPRLGDWATYNGILTGNRYSQLAQINKDNVKSLAVKWIFPIPHFGIETTPLVVDGVMYLTGYNEAYAIDAATGRQIWRYSRPRSAGLVGDASLGTNRGLAILGDKLFMVTDNAHLIALNRITGSLVWDVVMPDAPEHYGSTVAPLDPAETGVFVGLLRATKQKPGERLWRHWTIPASGEPGSQTWGPKEPLFGGGSTWLTGTYDPETDTLYWPTGNPYPDSDGSHRPGDNLFTDCILALDPGTGATKWYFQFTPHDTNDRDATEPPVLIDTKYHGQKKEAVAARRSKRVFLCIGPNKWRVTSREGIFAPSELGCTHRQ